jgi:hypothetical protein
MKFVLACISLLFGLYEFYQVFYIRPQLMPLYKDISESSLGIFNVMTPSGFILHILLGVFCLAITIFLFITRK